MTLGKQDGLLDGGADPPGGSDGYLHPGHVLEQDHELVAAETGEEIVTAHRGLEPCPDRDEEPVAGYVTKAVVDALEAVHVHEDQGVRLPV